jgi:hypothetical protein
LLLARVGLVLACAASLAHAELPASGTLAARHVIEALRATGAKVKPGERVDQPFFSVPATAIDVEGEGVQVFAFPNAAKAEGEAALVSHDGSKVGQSAPFWIGEPHFYRKANLIVLYLGENRKVLARLDAILGKQIAGR